MTMKILSAILLFATAGGLSGGPLELPGPGDTSVSVTALYNQPLKHMKEPGLLSRMGQHIEEYRLVYIPSFDRVFSVRVTKTGNAVALRAVMLGGRGWQPGPPVAEQSRALTAAEWEKVQTLLTAATFWQRPAVPSLNTRDGTIWAFEGTGEDRYRLVLATTPTARTEERGLGPLLELGKYLVTLSGLQLARPLE